MVGKGTKATNYKTTFMSGLSRKHPFMDFTRSGLRLVSEH